MNTWMLYPGLRMMRVDKRGVFTVVKTYPRSRRVVLRNERQQICIVKSKYLQYMP